MVVFKDTQKVNDFKKCAHKKVLTGLQVRSLLSL